MMSLLAPVWWRYLLVVALAVVRGLGPSDSADVPGSRDHPGHGHP